MVQDDSKQPKKPSAEDAAVNLIRSRINTLFGDDPKTNVKAKPAEPKTPTKPLSKHQRFMNELSESGRSLADIQTQWHNYYLNLSDDEKRSVWEEFYAVNKQFSKPAPQTSGVQHPPTKTHVYSEEPEAKKAKSKPKENISQLKRRVTAKASSRAKAKLSAKQQFKSLLFGFGMGSVVLLILLFGFFNERFVAPFITPSKSVSSTPIIIDPNSTTAGDGTLVIIPKINVEVPVVYNVNSINEKDIQNALEDGVVHYSTTANPGEEGNSVIVGHSSNNIFNNGKYKFAFVLLNRLEEGDTFSLTKNNKRYVYRVYKKEIVKPTDTSVLGPADKPATATLITCDPPGTSINRLIIVGEQISPNPDTNVASTAKQNEGQPAIVPGNAPSLWSRFTSWIPG